MTNTYKKRPLCSITSSRIKYMRRSIRKDMKRYASDDYVAYRPDTNKIWKLDMWDSTVLWDIERFMHYPSYSNRLYYIADDHIAQYLKPTVNRRHRTNYHPKF